MKPSITCLIRRAVELEGGKSQVNIAQARELIRCFAVAFTEYVLNSPDPGAGLDVNQAWSLYCTNSHIDHQRKAQRKPTKRKKKK